MSTRVRLIIAPRLRSRTRAAPGSLRSRSVPHDQSFVVAGVRVDASALEVKDLVTASITSTTDATSVPLGGGSAEGGVAGVVGEVAAALKVTAEKDADLACSAATPAPSITLVEGYAGAWGPTNLDNGRGWWR